MAETVLLSDLITDFTFNPINSSLWAQFTVCFEKRLPVPKELTRVTCGPRTACGNSLPAVARNTVIPRLTSDPANEFFG